eukprot:gene4864-6062_t
MIVFLKFIIEFDNTTTEQIQSSLKIEIFKLLYLLLDEPSSSTTFNNEIESIRNIIKNGLIDKDHDVRERSSQIILPIINNHDQLFNPVALLLLNIIKYYSESEDKRDNISVIKSTKFFTQELVTKKRQFLVNEIDQIMKTLSSILKSNKPSLVIKNFISNSILDLIKKNKKTFESNPSGLEIYLETLVGLLSLINKEIDEMEDIVESINPHLKISFDAFGELGRIMGGAFVLKSLIKVLPQFIKSQDWKQRFAAVDALKMACDQCDDISPLATKMVEIIKPMADDTVPRIRVCFFSFMAMGLMRMNLPQSQAIELLNVSIKKLLDSNHHVQTFVCSLIMMIISLFPVLKLKFKEKLLDTFVQLFSNSNNHPMAMLSAFQIFSKVTIDVDSKKDLQKYYDTFLPIFKNGLKEWENNLQVVVKFVVGISLFAAANDSTNKSSQVKSDLIETMNILSKMKLDFKNNDFSSYNSFFGGLGYIIKSLKDEFVPFIHIPMNLYIKFFNESINQDPKLDENQIINEKLKVIESLSVYLVNLLQPYEEHLIPFSEGMVESVLKFSQLESTSKSACEIKIKSGFISQLFLAMSFGDLELSQKLYNSIFSNIWTKISVETDVECLKSELFTLAFVNAATYVIEWNNPTLSNITISVGDTITWFTNDNQQHTVTSFPTTIIENNNDDNVAAPRISKHNQLYLDSPSISSENFSNLKRKYSQIFTREGLYSYHDKFNPESMVGTVRVLSSSSTDVENLGSKQPFLSLLFACLLGFMIFFIFS